MEPQRPAAGGVALAWMKISDDIITHGSYWPEPEAFFTLTELILICDIIRKKTSKTQMRSQESVLKCNRGIGFIVHCNHGDCPPSVHQQVTESPCCIPAVTAVTAVGPSLLPW